MLVEVTITRRFGRRIAERDLANTPPLVGEINLASTAYQAPLGTIEVLTLQNPLSTTAQGVIAQLFEPRLVSLRGDLMVFRGFEAVEQAGALQEWRCRATARSVPHQV